MVEGTGLENQRWKHPQVRILSFPPYFEIVDLIKAAKTCLEGFLFLKLVS